MTSDNRQFKQSIYKHRDTRLHSSRIMHTSQNQLYRPFQADLNLHKKVGAAVNLTSLGAEIELSLSLYALYFTKDILFFLFFVIVVIF